MMTIRQHLVAEGRQSHRSHAIVMAVVLAAALISASALPTSAPSGALAAAPRLEAVTADTRMIDASVIPQSLGYLEFDWSSAIGGVPGFAPLPDSPTTRANDA